MLHEENQVCKSKADHYGVIVSLLCAVHCAALPILLSIGLVESIHWANHLVVDILFLIASLGIAFFSLIKSFKNIHEDWQPMGIAGVGFILFTYSLFSHNHDQFIIPVAAGLLIAAAHLYNHRLVHSTSK